MDGDYFLHHSVKNFKRKRKENVNLYESIDEDKSSNYNQFVDNDYDSFSDSSSSNSTTPLYGDPSRCCDTSPNDCYSTDGSSSLKRMKKELSNSTDKSLEGLSNSIKSESMDNYMMMDEKDTFCVDIDRFRSFTTSAPMGNSFFTADLLGSSLEPSLIKLETPNSPPRLVKGSGRKTRNQIYKPHKHNRSVAVSKVPCKGPACKSQICCAQFCSQRCYQNQQRPIGTGGSYKSTLMDFEPATQPEINVTDYGLPYPDHTYCRDHKNIYFSVDPNVDRPPYVELVESLFYEEKEIRIRNPKPKPNSNGDPISSNGYVTPVAKRGRPKRANVIGLLNPYIFHPTTDVVYTPFVFKECIIEADTVSIQNQSQEPIVQAIRQCSNLYKDVRSGIPREVLYDCNNTMVSIDHLQHPHNPHHPLHQLQTVVPQVSRAIPVSLSSTSSSLPFKYCDESITKSDTTPTIDIPCTSVIDCLIQEATEDLSFN